jgi:polar amino acid transport system permease protein
MLNLLITYKDIFLSGFILTIKINFLAVLIGLPLALLLFTGRISESRAVKIFFAILIELIKGIPVLVLMFWMYLVLPLMSDLRLSAETSAIIALSLNYGANSSELFRSAWATASYELRMGLKLCGTPLLPSLLLFEAPFLIGVTMPGLLAQLAATIKLSAISAFIGLPEIFHSTQSVVQQTFRPVELYSGLACFYLIIVLLTSLLESLFRNRFS